MRLFSLAVLMTAVLMVLKVAGILSITWWWAFAPIWFPPVFLVCAIIGVTLMCCATLGFLFGCFYIYEKATGNHVF